MADAHRKGGICGAGGIAVKWASMDRRIKAVGTASAVNVASATRNGWEGKGSVADLFATLDALAKQRTVEAAGDALAYLPMSLNSSLANNPAYSIAASTLAVIMSIIGAYFVGACTDRSATAGNGDLAGTGSHA